VAKYDIVFDRSCASSGQNDYQDQAETFAHWAKKMKTLHNFQLYHPFPKIAST